MSEHIQKSDESASFGINRQDIWDTLSNFVKGMSREEVRRFEQIYGKFEDKGQKVDVASQR